MFTDWWELHVLDTQWLHTHLFSFNVGIDWFYFFLFDSQNSAILFKACVFMSLSFPLHHFSKLIFTSKDFLSLPLSVSQIHATVFFHVLRNFELFVNWITFWNRKHFGKAQFGFPVFLSRPTFCLRLFVFLFFPFPSCNHHHHHTTTTPLSTKQFGRSLVKVLSWRRRNSVAPMPPWNRNTINVTELHI